MISIEQSRDGRKILRKAGRLLASAVDPQKEAATWASRAIDGLDDDSSVVILGLGCGYHVQAVLHRVDKNRVVVIERDQSIADLAYQFCPEIASAKIIVEPDWSRITESGFVRDVLGDVYRLCHHLPSFLADREYYGRIENLFLGRDKTSFLLQLRSRPDLFALLDPERISELGDETISIKTIKGLFVDSPRSSLKERRMWKILEELVR